MFALGAMHSGGGEVDIDDKEARRWFTQAAERGHPIAALMLARYAARGLGGDRNFDAARWWYSHAASLGVPNAADELATLAGGVETHMETKSRTGFDGQARSMETGRW